MQKALSLNFELEEHWFPNWKYPPKLCHLSAVSICTRILKYRVWKIEFDELDFLSISNSNFVGYTGSKNLVQTRQKFQFIKLDLSNSIFQNPGADRYRLRVNVNFGHTHYFFSRTVATFWTVLRARNAIQRTMIHSVWIVITKENKFDKLSEI